MIEYGDALWEEILNEMGGATPEELAAALKEFRRQMDQMMFFLHACG